MRLALLLCALILASATADAAKIYKWTDQRGNPVYSDQPHPGAEEIEVSTEPAGIVPVPEEKLRRPRPPAQGGVYEKLAFTSPAKEETIRDNARTVTLALQVVPPLATASGHTIRLWLDGAALPTAYQTTDLVLTDLLTGTHTLQAMVADANGSFLILSDPLTFYLKVTSTDDPTGPNIYPPTYPPQPYPPTYPRQPYPPVYPKQGR